MYPELLAKIILIRHGETDHNRQGRFCGRSNPPLNQLGQTQADKAAAWLAQRRIDHIYTSPAVRAQRTAHTINQQRDKPITTDERLWETDYGRWEGQNIDDCRTADPEAWQKWLADSHSAPHGGETAVEVEKRTQSWLNDTLTRHHGQTVLVAAHGGSLQTVICQLMDMPHRPLWPFRFQNTTIAEVWLYKVGGVLVSFGNPHLDEQATNEAS